MTRSLDNKLPEGKVWEINSYVKDYRYGSTPRYIRVLFGSQDIDVSDVSNIGLWQIWTTLALTYILYYLFAI